MRKYSISKASSILQVTSQTLRNWDKDKILVPEYVSDSGYRYYSEKQLANFMKEKNKSYTFPKNNGKIFRDNIYGNIPIEYKIISDLIDTKEVQRLRRIRQLSGVSMVFHTAEHSRFAHSIGAYYIAYRMITESKDICESLSEYEKVVLLISALLHDIGHGPYSHAFEHVFEIKHEQVTCQMILDERTEINKVLADYPGLASDVSGIINHEGKFPIVESLVSSQLDVDRLDYLNRDAHFTGATYGFVDVDRLIRVTKVVKGQICYRAAGVHAIENYLMSRYHMYWQVYYHPKARSYEIILESIYLRIKDMIIQKKQIEADVTLLNNVFLYHDIEDYIDMDDAYINGIIKQLTKSNDLILNDLCNSFMNRKLFNFLYLRNEEETEQSLKIKNEYKNNEILSRYYYKEDIVSQVTYLTYLNSGNDIDVKNILILLDNGLLQSLEQYSPIVKGLLESGQKREKKVFFKKPSFGDNKNV